MSDDRYVRSFFQFKLDTAQHRLIRIGGVGKADTIKDDTSLYPVGFFGALVRLCVCFEDFDGFFKICRELIELSELIADHHHRRENLISKRDEKEEHSQIDHSFFE